MFLKQDKPIASMLLKLPKDIHCKGEACQDSECMENVTQPYYSGNSSWITDNSLWQCFPEVMNELNHDGKFIQVTFKL